MTCESFTFNTNKEIIKSTIKFLKTFELFSDLHLLFSKEHWMNSSLFKGFMYIYEQHLIAGILWLGSVLGSIPCMFYSFVGVYLYDFLVYLCRVRIKYYKVICKNCKACRWAPTMVGCNLPKFWNIHSTKWSKIVFLKVLHIKWIK